MKIGAPVVWDAGPPWEIWLEVREERRRRPAGRHPAPGGRAAGGRRGRPFVLGESGFLLAGDRSRPPRRRRLALGRAARSPRKPCASPPRTATSCSSACSPRPTCPRSSCPSRCASRRRGASPGRACACSPRAGTAARRAPSSPSSTRDARCRPARRDAASISRRNAGSSSATATPSARSDARLRELGFRPDPDSRYASGPPPPADRRRPDPQGGRRPPRRRVGGGGGGEALPLGRPLQDVRLLGRRLVRPRRRGGFRGADGAAPRDPRGDPQGAPVHHPGRRHPRRCSPRSGSGSSRPIARLGTAEGTSLRFRSVQAALLDAWLADEPDLA